MLVKPKCYKSKTTILHTLNVYKIPAKEHYVCDRWVANEISVFKILFSKYLEYVPLILCNCKQPIDYNDHEKGFSRKKKCPLNINILRKV